MNVLTNEQLKRRGIAAVEEALRKGPVHLVKRNLPAGVVVSEVEYSRLTARAASRDAAAPKRTSLEVFMSMDDRPGGLDAKGLAARIEEMRSGWNER